jgi:hypothetical protein
MLGVTNKSTMLHVVMQSVVMLNVVAPEQVPLLGILTEGEGSVQYIQYNVCNIQSS